MLKRWLWILGILCPLLACAMEAPLKPFSWRYGTGSNIDITTNTKTEFYRGGELVYADRLAGGGAGGLLADRIKGQRYYWAGGGGLPTDGVPVPDKAVIEMVSSHDRKRYRIKVNLPVDLEKQMRQVYLVDGRYDRRNRLYFGLAPGGYFEVVLTGGGLQLSPDKLLIRGIAEEVTDDWYDKKVPVARQYGMDDFDKKYGELFKQYPVPMGMDWAPIMDAYRAKQPRTDLEPVN
ncbi:putative lipoprotein [Aeromonas encheleia]|nr:putative lipoprotein [Aeromonas encheleia]